MSKQHWVKVDGVPIPVFGAKSQAQAEKDVAEALQSDPEFMDRARADFVEFGGSATDRFLIGAGRRAQEAIDFVGDQARGLVERIAPGGDGRFGEPDRARREAVAAQRQRDADYYSALDDQAFAAEDFGELLPDAAIFLASGGGAVVKSGLGLVSNLASSGLKLAGKPLEGFARLMMQGRNGREVTVKEAMELLQQPGGKEAAKALSKMEPAQADALLGDIMKVYSGKKPAGRAVQQPGATRAQAAPEQPNPVSQAATQKVREAQLRANREMQQRAAQREAQESAAAGGDSAQALADRLAQSNFSRIEQQAMRQTDQKQLRELIRRANTGGAP